MDSDNDQGANLVFRPDPVGPPAVVKLEGVGVGLECPGFLTARGPVKVAGQTINVDIRFGFDPGGIRYKVVALSLGITDLDDELDPDMLRKVRWAEMVAPGLDTSSRFIAFDSEGVQERHRSLVTLSTDQQTAVLWLTARIAGMDANRHIADVLGISASAAAARVKKLRASGVLPAAVRGQRR
jgi:hypothetical protein